MKVLTMGLRIEKKSVTRIEKEKRKSWKSTYLLLKKKLQCVEFLKNVSIGDQYDKVSLISFHSIFDIKVIGI